MTNFLPSSSLSKILDKSIDESVDPELPVLSSNQTEPTVNQGKINQIKLTIYFYIILH